MILPNKRFIVHNILASTAFIKCYLRRQLMPKYFHNEKFSWKKRTVLIILYTQLRKQKDIRSSLWFLQAACHRDQSISKKAVSYIHDVINALLNSQAELPHFHFCEALFKPFENLLCLELCDTDVQDQASKLFRNHSYF